MTVNDGSLLRLLVQEDQRGQETGDPFAQDAEVDFSQREEGAGLEERKRTGGLHHTCGSSTLGFG